MSNEPGSPWYHEDLPRFRDALTLTEAETGFSSRLIEKDYYCSLLLDDLSGPFEQGLVFKGGTCLSKVHAEFFRLSEDLDFSHLCPARCDEIRASRSHLADQGPSRRGPGPSHHGSSWQNSSRVTMDRGSTTGDSPTAPR